MRIILKKIKKYHLTSKVSWLFFKSNQPKFVLNEILQLDSKDNIEFTDENIKNQNSLEMYSSGMYSVEESKSDDEDIELPLKIKMDGISYEICLDIIRYIYTDYCEVTLENSMKLLKAASTFKLEKLKETCERKISSSINWENVAQVLMDAHVTQADTLKELWINFVVSKFDIVSKTDSFLRMVTSNSELTVEILKRR